MNIVRNCMKWNVKRKKHEELTEKEIILYRIEGTHLLIEDAIKAYLEKEKVDSIRDLSDKGKDWILFLVENLMEQRKDMKKRNIKFY